QSTSARGGSYGVDDSHADLSASGVGDRCKVTKSFWILASRSADRKGCRSNAEIVQGTRHALAPLLHDVGVDHRGGHIGVAEQVLNGADVGATLQQMGSKGMPKSMGADGLRQPGTADGDFDGFVDDAGIHMMTTGDTGAGVDGEV